MISHEDIGTVLTGLYRTLDARKTADPAQSYVASLYHQGLNVILKKIGEEAGETLIAAKEPDDAALVHELADLWFHTMVLMAARDLPLQSIADELAHRRGRSGFEEKASRPTRPT